MTSGDGPIIPPRPNINNFGKPIKLDEGRAVNAGRSATPSLQKQIDDLRVDVGRLTPPAGG
jgi:hypothetical protein